MKNSKRIGRSGKRGELIPMTVSVKTSTKAKFNEMAASYEEQTNLGKGYFMDLLVEKAYNE